MASQCDTPPASSRVRGRGVSTPFVTGACAGRGLFSRLLSEREAANKVRGRRSRCVYSGAADDGPLFAVVYRWQWRLVAGYQVTTVSHVASRPARQHGYWVTTDPPRRPSVRSTVTTVLPCTHGFE